MEENYWSRSKNALQREWKATLRYLLVGSSSFAVKAGSYAVLSRLLWTGGNRNAINVIAVACAMIYNYTSHRYWTFRHQKPAPGSASRYLIVAVSTSVLDAILFSFLHGKLGFYDFGVLIFNGATIAVVGFLSHRLFTFHSNPWKRAVKPEAVILSQDEKRDDVVQSG